MSVSVSVSVRRRIAVFTVSLTSYNYVNCVHSCISSWTGEFHFSEVQINLHSLRSLSGSNLAAMAEAESLTEEHVSATRCWT